VTEVIDDRGQRAAANLGDSAANANIERRASQCGGDPLCATTELVYLGVQHAQDRGIGFASQVRINHCLER
jgi:hypothetical protein